MSSLGIISALPSEAKCITEHPLPVNKPVRLKDGLIIIVSGMGVNSVKKACVQLLDMQVTTLVSWGTAAGLVNKLSTGDLILPDKIKTSSGHNFNTDISWNQKINESLSSTSIKIHRETLYSSDVMLSTPGQKMQVNLETGSIAADMESETIAKVASENKISFFVIRSVIDELNHSIPECVIKNIDPYGHINIYYLLLELFCKPKLIADIYYLHHAMKKSCYTLKTIANKIQDML